MVSSSAFSKGNSASNFFLSCHGDPGSRGAFVFGSSCGADPAPGSFVHASGGLAREDRAAKDREDGGGVEEGLVAVGVSAAIDGAFAGTGFEAGACDGRGV